MNFLHTTTFAFGLYVLAGRFLCVKLNIKAFAIGYYANIIGLLLVTERMDSLSTLGYLIVGILVQYSGILRINSSELLGYRTSGLHIALLFIRDYNKWQNKWQNKNKIEVNVSGFIVLAIIILSWMITLYKKIEDTERTERRISILPILPLYVTKTTSLHIK